MNKVYGFTDAGNFHDEATGQTTGKNIPFLSLQPQKDLIIKLDIKSNKLDSIIEESRRKAFNYREKRIHPLKDDKILTDWNGLMIASFALAGQVLDDKEYVLAAEKAAEFVQKILQLKKVNY